MPILAVDDALAERLTDALRNATVNLTGDDHGIELAATVVYRDVAGDLHLAGVLVDLHRADMRAEREGEIFRLKEGRCLQSRFDTFGEQV